ncbi:MAG: hypothetical protein M3O85_03855 [Acidobacteriota bacterium]|nr:hypothetical protein [Acidobacteriota bacterium]
MAISRAAADFQAQLVLMMLYFTVLVPFGLVARFQSASKAQPSPQSDWAPRTEPASTLESLRRQF